MKSGKNTNLISASIIMAVLCISGNLWAYSGGDGSTGNPYQIANVADFQQLSTTPSDWYWSFILTANIDLTGETLTPIGNDSTPFTGIFDGSNNVISNAVINQPGSDYVGLFGYVGYGSGQIINLGIENINMTGRNAVGGLVGMTDSGTLTSCYATGSVSGTGVYVGGLVGYNIVSSLTSCYATGSVTGTGNDVGGLVGINNSGTLTGCYATGSVSGTYTVGGLVGDNTGSTTVSNCYATGSVTGTDSYVGGLVGGNGSGTLTKCYSTGLVSGYSYVGGLAGWNGSGTITACFWDTETSATSDGVGNIDPDPAGAMGKTTAEMMTQSTFVDWDFYGNPPIWTIQENITYPHLFWESGTVIPPQYTGGSGTSIDPYQITNVADWQLLMASPADWDKYFIQTADINMQNIEMTPVGNDANNFTGSFDGQSYSISNAYIYMPDSDYVGLFGYVGSGGQIENSGVVNVNITGRSFVGGLVGYGFTTTVSNCYATGSVTGTGAYGYGYEVGGLVGYNDSGSIASCYATCSVSGNALVGGLVGENNGWTGGGTITSCYATGAVSGNLGSIGGLVGVNWGTLTDCNATGPVSGYGGIGGLVGRNWNTLTECYATGLVSGSFDVGGLAGLNEAGALITTCYATGSASGTGNYIGGLVGYNNSTLTDCYAEGEVNGIDYVGGLVGTNDYGYGYGILTSCYATGVVNGNNYVGGLAGTNSGTLTSCYFLVTSGPDNGIGTPLTNEEMKQQISFIGWDFTTIWAICEGSNYPRLLWQIPIWDLVCPAGIDLADFASFASQWLQTDCQNSNNCSGADFDRSGTVDAADLAILVSHWLEGI